MKRQTGLFRKSWIFFKKGKSEIWFLISLYNTIQLWTLRGLNIYNGVLFLIALAISAFFLGIVLTKKVDTTNPYVNPYTQDNIKASILFYQAMREWFKGNTDKAFELIDKSLEIRYKWLDKGLLK